MVHWLKENVIKKYFRECKKGKKYNRNNFR